MIVGERLTTVLISTTVLRFRELSGRGREWQLRGRHQLVVIWGKGVRLQDVFSGQCGDGAERKRKGEGCGCEGFMMIGYGLRNRVRVLGDTMTVGETLTIVLIITTTGRFREPSGRGREWQFRGRHQLVVIWGKGVRLQDVFLGQCRDGAERKRNGEGCGCEVW
ncbi:hypothetical protein ACFE04_021191 [Oxalis oulophora]